MAKIKKKLNIKTSKDVEKLDLIVSGNVKWNNQGGD